MDDPNAQWTPARREARAKELDAEGDRLVALVIEGQATEAAMRGWLRCRQWARKLRGYLPLTAEQMTAELVGLGLKL
jgi:hypothetical protein